jgi:ABC-2 type transport system permease protein
MVSDILTILWKEVHEMFSRRPGFRGGWFGMLVFVVVFGALIPAQSGPEWINSPGTVLVWAWVPFILVNSVVADAFAGERERHTLETLLASRLSDRAILIGKLSASIVYGWGLTLVSVLVSLVTVNLLYGDGKLLLFSPSIALGILVASFLVAALAAGLGVLVSLHASSVRQAQQTLSIAMFAVIIPLIALPLLPEAWRQQIDLFFMKSDMLSIAIGALFVLLVADGILLAAAIARFQRARLILD